MIFFIGLAVGAFVAFMFEMIYLVISGCTECHIPKYELCDTFWFAIFLLGFLGMATVSSMGAGDELLISGIPVALIAGLHIYLTDKFSRKQQQQGSQTTALVQDNRVEQPQTDADVNTGEGKPNNSHDLRRKD